MNHGFALVIMGTANGALMTLLLLWFIHLRTGDAATVDAGWAGESAADAQLKKFRSDPSIQGCTCQTGLRMCSRHANYFFGWLIRVTFPSFTLDSPARIRELIRPDLILYFVLRVTGIPATEAQAIRTRSEEYRRYQQTTLSFAPWFPKAIPQEKT